MELFAPAAQKADAFRITGTKGQTFISGPYNERTRSLIERIFDKNCPLSGSSSRIARGFGSMLLLSSKKMTINQSYYVIEDNTVIIKVCKADEKAFKNLMEERIPARRQHFDIKRFFGVAAIAGIVAVALKGQMPLTGAVTFGYVFARGKNKLDGACKFGFGLCYGIATHVIVEALQKIGVMQELAEHARTLVFDAAIVAGSEIVHYSEKFAWKRLSRSVKQLLEQPGVSQETGTSST
jgi:hypothetical protein